MDLVMFVAVVFLLSVNGIDSSESLKKPEISSLHIHSDIKYRFATTRVTCRIKNSDTQSREAVFDVTLPNEAFITNLTLEIDGKIIQGEIKEKEAAKQQYEAAKQRGESAGYVGTVQRETNRFNLAVAVAAQSKVSFNLTYQELLKRKHGHYEQVIYIDPGQPITDMDITVAILESREITLLRVPPLRNDVNDDIKDLSTITVISQPTPKTAEIKFVPSIEFQIAQSTSGMAGQFVVQYDVEREMDAGDVLLVNGYFVHFFAPEGFKPIPNDVLFILDTSGSMTGTKLSQLKQAMSAIIAQLNNGDRFNMMTFSGSTSFWKPEMVHVSDEDIMEEAKLFIKHLQASGWTNIELALRNGIDFLATSVTSGDVRSPVIVFLTDGEATQGVTNKEEILDNVRKLNEGKIPIFSLAFGLSADYDLVKKVAIQNNGIGRKIYEASDAAMQIAGFYNEISVTLLSNLTFQYLDAPVSDVTQHTFTNYFNGSELVICGRLERYAEEMDNALTSKVISNSAGKRSLVLTGLTDKILDISNNFTESADFEQITEKVWAYLTIKQLLDKEHGALTDEQKTEYKQQALELSLKYKFVTPLTSMVVTLPDQDGKTNKPEVIDADDTPSSQSSSISRSMAKSYHPPVSAGYQRLATFHSLPNRPPGLPGAMGLYGLPYQGLGRPLPTLTSGLDSSITDDDFDMPSSLPKVISPSDVDSAAISKFGERRAKRLKKKNERKQKRKDRRNNRKSGLSYPLVVTFQNFEDPLCFNLYDAKLETLSLVYLMYKDPTSGMKMEVNLEGRQQGKWTRQGGIKVVILTHGQTLTQINSSNFGQPVSNSASLPWNVTVRRGTNGTDMLVQLQDFSVTVTKADDGYLLLMSNRSLHQVALSGEGLLGEIWSKNVVLLKELDRPSRKNKKPAKHIAVFKMNGKKFPAFQRVMGADKCWSMRPKKEAAFADLAAWEV